MEINKNKLVKLLGMLGSTHDGEVVAAARAAERMLKEAGITWAELFSDSQPVEPVQASYEATHSDYYQDEIIRRMVDECIRYGEKFTKWETNFLHSLKLQKHFTPKQISMLEALYEQHILNPERRRQRGYA